MDSGLIWRFDKKGNTKKAMDKNFPLFFFLFFIILLKPLLASDYKASLFGIKSDGMTLNTRSIQKAIDFIHAKGGGRLIFDVGRYLTGTIYLKSNVTLHLLEGAVLVGSPNPLDYDQNRNWTALIFALEQENIGLTGQGVIDGQGFIVANNLVDLIHKGITVDSKAYWNNDGVDIVDCNEVEVARSYFDSADDGICLKSHDKNSVCQNIYIHHNTVRSSANGIKFETASWGGFKTSR